MTTGVFEFPDIRPGDHPESLTDHITDNILVIQCDDDDRGGAVRIVGEKVEHENEHDPETIQARKILNTIYLKEGEKHIDFIGMSPFELSEIAQLVVQHKPGK